MKQRFIFVGDFSGLSLFLSRGVAACDFDVKLYSNGDGWKGIPHSNQLFKIANNPLQSAWNQVQGAFSLSASVRHGDTLVLSTEFLFNRWINASMLRHLMSKAERTILLHAGCSDGFHRLNKNEFLCRSCKQYDLNSEKCVFDYTRWLGLKSVLPNLDLIVPFTDVYLDSAQMFGLPTSRVTAPLHFPIDFDYVQSQVRGAGNRSGVVHGQNRSGFKGTAYLREMMIASPSLLPMIELLPRMPFVSFIDRMNSAQVILDQLFANGYGMTGALALANGTSVAYGYTKSQPAREFDGPGCIPVPITGDTTEDARTLIRAIHENLLHPPDRNTVIEAARCRHDHVLIGTNFIKMLS